MVSSPKTVPSHVGIIMDGNGRWAKRQGLKRSQGHREGVKAAKSIVKKATDLGIDFLSLYVFSTENWKRTKEEVSFLMILIKQYLKQEYQFYIDNRIKVIHSGDRQGLPADILKEIDWVISETAGFSGLTVNLLINYGGKNELVRAFQKIVKNNPDPALITEDLISRSMDNGPLPPVDLLIRTGGDLRSSNFLLWQTAYAEYFFTPVLWPDFKPENFEEAIASFKKRDRRWGGYNKDE